tara:strand:- start:11715 stop:12425 length:711 start_codon:yes stop_codon:yes gene_type:complete
MFGIDPLTIPSLMILAGATSACPQQEPTKINIVPRTAQVTYDHRQSLKQIQEYSTDTVDPYGFHGQTITQGFMKGQIELRHKIQFGQVKNTGAGLGCVWYNEIKVTIDIDPTIVIAKEMYNDSCMRKAILGHELKHVRVDREIVNKYAKSMGEKLMKALQSRGFSAGPFELSRMDEIMGKMQRVVSQILELEYKKLGIERQERQREVDSLEEYNSVDDKCPAFKERKQKLYSSILE